MDAFDKLLSEAKQHQAAKKKATKKKKSVVNQKVMGRSDIGPAPIQNPWQEESLVLVMTVQTCQSCGSEHTSYNPYLLLERTRIFRGQKERHLERIKGCDYEMLYGQYPQKIEVHEHRTCACPKCFGITHPAGNNLQLNLPLGE